MMIVVANGIYSYKIMHKQIKKPRIQNENRSPSSPDKEGRNSELKKEIAEYIALQIGSNVKQERILKNLQIIYGDKIDAGYLEKTVQKAYTPKPSLSKPSTGDAAGTTQGGASPKLSVAAPTRRQPHIYEKSLDYIWSTNIGSDYIRAGATASKDILGSKALNEIDQRLGDKELSSQKELRTEIKILSKKPANELAAMFEERLSPGLQPVTNYYRGMRASDFKKGLNGNEYTHPTFMAVTPDKTTAEFFISKEGTDGIIIQVSGQAAGIRNIFGESEFVFPPRSVFSVKKDSSGRYILKQK